METNKKLTIVAATGNKGKLKEIKDIFPEFNIVSIKELGIDIDIDEDAKTFADNALKKAQIYAKATGLLCLADDSGIAIQYYGGFPGVKTKRWMSGTDRERNQAIVQMMEDIPKEKRSCDFVTAIAIANADNAVSTVKTHTIHGYISTEIRGENGFGFDEIFELEDGRTIAELSDEEKNSLSPRKHALEAVRKTI